uniref:ATP synthase F0 subunit 8 n=1 Tax=Rhynocoris marginatus TaxID=656738 RepID=UPI0022F2BFF1|nr:ATP synthase F0 subunit 8 [Rhynocoris marginatus]WAJ48445.1 ATP synthase F0 subunit 8 [Rhynocoris marginatus]
MPQMAPIWWTTLFIMFNMAFITMMVSIYFQIENLPTLKKQMTSESKKFNWKW